MKNASVALAGEFIDCSDGQRREFRVSMLMMCLIQEHYQKQEGQESFVFYRDFDWQKHLENPELTSLLLWAGLAHEESKKGTLAEWTIEKCKSVVSPFDIPKIVSAIQRAAEKGLSEDQKASLEARSKKKTDPKLNTKGIQAKKKKIKA